MSRQNLIWKTNDCKGRIVSLYEQERDHIIEGHPGMGENFVAVKETIEQPDVIRSSTSHIKREIYSRSSTTALNIRPPHVLKVVVEFTDNTIGKVVTAFPGPEKGGRVGDILYKKS